MTEPDELSDAFFADHFGRSPVMGIFRSFSPEATADLCRTAFAAGITLVEVPLTGPDSFGSLAAALQVARAHSGVCVGAGTVLWPAQVAAVHDAGAQFTVAPGVHPDAIAASQGLELPHLPGVATSTDIAHAMSFGYTWLKAFPAAQLGVGWIAAQHGPFPTINFVATGGVNPDNAGEFLAGGCAGVALGSAFADPRTAGKLADLIGAQRQS